VEPSKPNEPNIDRTNPIPRSRPADDQVLEGEIIGRDVPLGGPRTTPPEPPPMPPKPAMSLRRTLLLVVIVVSGLVCLAGSITAYVLYDKATQPERGTPAVSLEQYLSAKFGQRDEVRAQLFVCKNPQLDPVDALLTLVKEREAQTKVGLQVTLGDLTVEESLSSATIKTNLNIAAAESGGASSVIQQRWEFVLVDTEGWRVCGAKSLL